MPTHKLRQLQGPRASSITWRPTAPDPRAPISDSSCPIIVQVLSTLVGTQTLLTAGHTYRCRPTLHVQVLLSLRGASSTRASSDSSSAARRVHP